MTNNPLPAVETQTQVGRRPRGEAMGHIKTAIGCLLTKGAKQTNYWDYYDGDQPVSYTARRLEAIFQQLDAKFTQNWCAVVIDACADRINLTGFKAKNKALQPLVDAIWQEQQLALESDDVHLGMQVAGEAYAILWRKDLPQPADEAEPAEADEYGPTENDPAPTTAPTDLLPEPKRLGELQVYYNDARLVHLQYDAEDPRQKAWAAKWWVGEDGHRRLTLYYADQLEYYRCSKKDTGQWKPGDFKLIVQDGLPNPAPNPFGVIPVYHFRVQKRVTKSDLANVIPLQNGINKLLADMLVTAEFSAFRQRWVISQSSTSDLKNAPGKVWSLAAGDSTMQDTQVGEFQESNLENFLKPIDALAVSVAAITRTPKHYLLAQGGDLSGEALIAMEAPLTRKAKDRIDRASPVWQEVVALALKLQYDQVVKPGDIEPIWDSVKTVLPLTEAEVRKQTTDTAGLALRTALRWEGKNEDEIALAEKERDEEQARKDELLDAASERAAKNFDQGKGPGGVKPPAPAPAQKK